MADKLNEITIERRDTRNITASGKVFLSDSGSPICCHVTDGSGRNLVLCIDGSSNQFGEKNTNVIELYNLVLKRDEDRQQTWYNSGIGTYARPSWKSIKYYRQVVYHKVDLAIAWDFERTVLAAYRWLSDNYQTGDCIFLFGFSRGAFQVRVLSAMIDKVGLIHKGNEMQIPFAYELYADPESDKITVTQVGSKDKMSSADRFKKAFSREDVKVHFVGTWDTVSSIGIARGTNMLPRTVDGMQHVCFFRHALALDERRVKFLPEFAYGGSTKPPSKQSPKWPWTWKFWLSDRQADVMVGHKETVTDTDSNNPPHNTTTNSETKRPHTLEVWFAGTHSDIGGGNVENIGMDRSRPPLRWMVLEAGGVGLRTAPFGRDLSPKEQIEIKESLTWHWWFLEFLPLKRLTYTRRENGTPDTRKPHLGSPRKIHGGQKIHSSFLLADKLINGKPYTPKARPIDDDPNFWKFAHEGGLGEWLGQDLYDYVDDIVKRFVDNLDNNLLENLHQIALGADGQQAVCEGLYKSIIDTLKVPDSECTLDKKWRLLKSTADILIKSPGKLMQTHSLEIRTLIRGLGVPTSPDDCQTAKQFMDWCTNSCIHTLHGHTWSVSSVALSPNGKWIASGSWDETICIWASETGTQVGESLKGHTDLVWSVAFSPDNKHIVSGSSDHTVRLWDPTTGLQISEPFKGHTLEVIAVAFSPDGTRVVSGSLDKTVRIWNCETGDQIGEVLMEHTDEIKSVAFSPDGTHIVSGSADGTIRLWNFQTGIQVGQPFTGHTNYVMSVGFSPDRKRIVSGSLDMTIRNWDVKMEKQVGESFQGLTDYVLSVAFSPDGRRIVSGLSDRTVRIWDAEMGKQIGEPFRGHTDPVYSVMFFPDGKRVVSGSADSTVRIWDAEIYLAADYPVGGAATRNK